MSKVTFCLALHNHQPVGNFDSVFRQAFLEAYEPFLEELERFPEIPMTLHFSGPLLEWSEKNHPGFLDRLLRLVKRGQVELMAGGFYEPILTMLNEEDRRGQIRIMVETLRKKFNYDPDGIWLAERVWEQNLVYSIANEGLHYTLLDDNHFLFAGLRNEELYDLFLTEDRGHLLRLFPISEKLRYAIPFREPQETLSLLSEVAENCQNPCIVYGDDGEKFGLWPGTHKHVYKDGWLRSFFEMLKDNLDWIRVATLGKVCKERGELKKVYLPDASYQEMMEWALPSGIQIEYREAKKKVEGACETAQHSPFVRGGVWRNFKVKYPETNNLYGKGMWISRRLEAISGNGARKKKAVRELYQGQCNCPYWHGVFGGLYLPHLRSAAFHHLIKAENMLDELEGRKKQLYFESEDFDLDGTNEVCLSNGVIRLRVKPALGGQIYELDLISKAYNLLNTLCRREESYHRDILESTEQGGSGIEKVKSIHELDREIPDAVDKLLFYDPHPRYCLCDHFLDNGVLHESLITGSFEDQGNFLDQPYTWKKRMGKASLSLLLEREGWVRTGKQDLPITLQKNILLQANKAEIRITYNIHNRSKTRIDTIFCPEANFAFFSTDQDIAYYRKESGEKLGGLLHEYMLDPTNGIEIVDEAAAIRTFLSLQPEAGLSLAPIQTVSHSEKEIELTFQGTTLYPLWRIEIAPGEVWTGKLSITAG